MDDRIMEECCRVNAEIIRPWLKKRMEAEKQYQQDVAELRQLLLSKKVEIEDNESQTKTSQYHSGDSMTSLETILALSAYLVKAGIENVTVDEDSLLLTSSGVKRIGDFPEKETMPGAKNTERDFTYYFDLEYRAYHPKGIWGDPDINPSGIKVYSSEAGVFVVSPANYLMMVCPIYECHGATVHKNICMVTGHEQAATIVLNDLEESFCEYTR